MMKHYFLAVIFFGLFVNAQPSLKNNILIPYYQNNEWGLSLKDKSVKVIPQYDAIVCIYPYFLAQKDDVIEILNDKGKSIGKDYLYVGEIKKDTSYLFIKESTNPSETYILEGNNILRYENSFYLYKLENNKFKKLTDETSDAIIVKIRNGRAITPNLFFVTKNGLTGVYDVVKERYLIEPKYKNFRIPNGDYIIAYNSENDLEIKHKTGTLLPKNPSYLNNEITEILDNGYYIVSLEGQKNLNGYGNHRWDLRTPEGKTVINGGLNMRVLKDIGMIRCPIENTLKENKPLYNYYDLQGNLLLSEIRDYKMSSPNLIGIFGKGYDNLIGLYNYKSRKMVWENNFPETSKVKLIHNSDFGFSQIEVDTTFYYFDDKGNNIAKTGGYNRHYNRYKMAKTIKVSAPYNPDNPFKYKYFTALRNSEKKPFVIYDENYQKVENMQDFLGNFNQNIYAFKENNKWKLADFDGLVLSEQYDSITFTKTEYNFRLYKDGKSQIYLKKAKKLIPAYDYDDAIGYEHHDYYLGIKYLEKLRRGDDYRGYKYLKCQVDLIDNKGNVVYSFINDPEIGIKYALTKTNQIIEYPDDNKYFYFRIHNTKTKEIKDIKERFLYFESYKDMPVVAVLASESIVDDGKKGLWNINKEEWIRPLKKESITYQSQEIDFLYQKEKLNALSLIEVTDNPEYYKNPSFFSGEPQRFYTIMGYIGIDGTFYVD